jgi:hypothetical protein
MNEVEQRANAMLQEMATQRNSALDRCATMAAEMAVLQAKIAELEKPNDTPPANEKPPRPSCVAVEDAAA